MGVRYPGCLEVDGPGIGEMIEGVDRLDGLLPLLLVPEYEIDPLVQVPAYLQGWGWG